ncbi:hypothetical protein P4V41_12000 [Fictibacillus nanhaiensis]|uniref:hypothetical protein n=1 Tax=Fictibacillus nanhaiensis TaxID=742169 RepID=UPI002E1F642B|nr:hypothetical protein [Fictibacillus nanhaiensis]
MKSGSGSFSSDKQKVNGLSSVLCFIDHLTFDLEELATATRQVRHSMARSGEGLTVRPAESEQPEAEINHLQEHPKEKLNNNFLF